MVDSSFFHHRKNKESFHLKRHLNWQTRGIDVTFVRKTKMVGYKQEETNEMKLFFFYWKWKQMKINVFEYIGDYHQHIFLSKKNH